MKHLSKYKQTFEFGYDEEEWTAAAEVLKDNRWVWDKEQTALLEKEFCDYFGSKYAIPVSNGSSGLICALAALGVGPGDEVITTCNSHNAVPMYILANRAKPVLVDVVEDILQIDPELIEKAITKKTKALMPVVSSGHPYDLDPIMEIAEKHGLPVVHDAAQSMGSKYKGKFIGQYPDVTVFSFAVHKHVCVNGGMVLLDDDELADKIWAKRSQGASRHRPRDRTIASKMMVPASDWGFSCRMYEVMAALARVQFKKFRVGPQRVELRRQIARLYDLLLADVPEIRTPIEKEWAYHSYCRYIVRAERRDELYNYLHGKGIEVFIHYYTPLHMHPFMVDIFGNQEGKFPVSEKTAKEILTLPSWPYQTAQDVDSTIETIKEFYKT